jgi:hypothetical protein
MGVWEPVATAYRIGGKQLKETPASPEAMGYAAGVLVREMIQAAEDYVCELVVLKVRRGFQEALKEQNGERP